MGGTCGRDDGGGAWVGVASGAGEGEELQAEVRLQQPLSLSFIYRKTLQKVSLFQVFELFLNSELLFPSRGEKRPTHWPIVGTLILFVSDPKKAHVMTHFSNRVMSDSPRPSAFDCRLGLARV